MASMLSTIDNMFDPFDEFDQWLAQDSVLGHNCCGLLARFSFTSPALSDSQNSDEIEQAIDSIIENDMTGLYIKVTK